MNRSASRGKDRTRRLGFLEVDKSPMNIKFVDMDYRLTFHGFVTVRQGSGITRVPYLKIYRGKQSALVSPQLIKECFIGRTDRYTIDVLIGNLIAEPVTTQGKEKGYWIVGNDMIKALSKVYIAYEDENMYYLEGIMSGDTADEPGRKVSLNYVPKDVVRLLFCSAD